ncbi:MAG TPA: hypothetical protein VMR37_00435 [Rhabdochlamydiaceae bacterium]|nr:hypothetical protein [Rhabdochlamydiaceae bacterium]
MLKCFYQQEGKLFLIYWIKHGRTQIMGGFAGDCWSHLLGFPVEWHFNYPKDGRLHYSYKKCSERADKRERYITAYVDQIKDKTISPEGIQDTQVMKGKILLNHLLPLEQPCPFDDYEKQEEKCFNFPTTGISIPISLDAVNLGVFRPVNARPDRNAIVLDAQQLGAGILNVSAFICSKSYTMNSSEGQWLFQDNIKLPRIGLYVKICR